MNKPSKRIIVSVLIAAVAVGLGSFAILRNTEPTPIGNENAPANRPIVNGEKNSSTPRILTEPKIEVLGNTKKIFDDDLGFNFQFPKNWHIINDKTLGVAYIRYYSMSPDAPFYPDSYYGMVQSTNRIVDLIVREKQINRSFEGISVLERKKVSIGGQESEIVHFETVEGGKRKDHLVLDFSYEGKYFSLEADLDETGEVERGYNLMVQSFRFD